MMEFENLSKTPSPLLKNSSKNTSITRIGIIYSTLSELDEKFEDFFKEILDLEKSGIPIGSLISQLEEISKTIKDAKSKIKQGGRKNAQKDS